jgi:uncharacterized membrane protein YidH (DUF202 family)
MNIQTPKLRSQGSSIILRDEEGYFVPVCSLLDEGHEYAVLELPSVIGVNRFMSDTVASAVKERPDNDLRAPFLNRGNDQSNEFLHSVQLPPSGGMSIEDRLTKFERMSSHLANERTFLAWVRTAVSVAGLAVTYSSLTPHHNIGLFWFGSTFSWAVGLGVFFVGVSRYYTVKEVLNLPKNEITNRFNRRGIMVIIFSFGCFLALMSVVYIGSLYSDTK